MFKGFFKKTFKKVRMGNVGKTVLIVVVAVVVIAAVIYIFAF